MSLSYLKFKKEIKQQSEKNVLIQKAYLLAHKLKVASRKRLDDTTYAKRFYMDKLGLDLNLDNPRTFDEKLWWLKLHYRNPLQTICADKYSVRDYITSCGGTALLNELYAVYETVDEIYLNDLPDEFFLKTSHGCGVNFWCHDKATFPIAQVKKKLSRAMKQNYYYESREWPYKEIKPRIIAEKVLKPVNPAELLDYRFLCFNGVCQYVLVDVGTCAADGSHTPDAKRNVYNRNGKQLPVKITRETFDLQRTIIPKNFLEMRNWAEKLSRPFPHVRVDLYSFDSLIRFGELTFFHMGGCNHMEPTSFQNTLGDFITLPNGDYVI